MQKRRGVYTPPPIRNVIDWFSVVTQKGIMFCIALSIYTVLGKSGRSLCQNLVFGKTGDVNVLVKRLPTNIISKLANSIAFSFGRIGMPKQRERLQRSAKQLSVGGSGQNQRICKVYVLNFLLHEIRSSG